MSGVQTTLMGWCNRGDQFHNLCRRSFVSAVGVTWTCDCPRHEDDEKEG